MALAALSSRLHELFDSPPTREKCFELLAYLHEVGELGVWCRGAGLALARLTDPPITFREMQDHIQVPRSTLSDRYLRWLKIEQREGRQP